MNNKRHLMQYFLYLIILFSGLALWFGCTKSNEHDHALQLEKSEKTIYQCPMHPQITSDKPGQSCPICGMTLVAIKKGSTQGLSSETMPEEHAQVQIAPGRQQSIGIKLDKVEKRKLFKVIRAPGRIAFDPDLYTAQNEYLEALKQWQNVRNSPLRDTKISTQEMIKSVKIRLRVLGMSDSQINELSKKKNISEGLLLSGKNQENWIYADVFEIDLPHIHKGLSVAITGSALEEDSLVGTVSSVDQVINPKTRTAKVRIQLQKNDLSIRPESYVNVAIYAPLGEHLAVPLDAIMDTGRETFVFIKRPKDHYEPLRVKVTLRTDQYAAISGGVSIGDEIVVDGNFMLDSESRLKDVLQTAGHQH